MNTDFLFDNAPAPQYVWAMYNRVDSGPCAAPGRATQQLFRSDKMGHSHLQFEACRLLVGLLIDYLSNLMRLYRVGGELTCYLDPDDLTQMVVPDLYILEDEPQAGPKVPSWKPWEHDGKVPTLAIEVVSDSYRKDYAPEEIQPRYQRLGVQEVVRYDPDHAAHPRAKYPRRLFGHFVRTAQGLLVEQRVEGEALRLHTYPLWLVHEDPYYLRIGTGLSAESLNLWPTEGERARSAMDQARSAMGQARSQAERAGRAEEEVARLLEEIKRLRGDK